MTTSSSGPSGGGGIGFVGLLTIALIVLKLVGVIAWPWWLVLAPIWVAGGLAALALVLGVLVIASVEGRE